MYGLSMLLSSALVAFTPLLVAGQTTPSAKCAPLHVIALRGLNLVGDPDLYQFLRGSVNQIVAAVPGADSVGLPYNAGDQNRVGGVSNGTAMLQQYVEAYMTSCPKAKIGILGYSDGATAASNAICGTAQLPYTYSPPLDPKYANDVVATVVWGDLTRAPFQAWDQGTCPAYMPGVTARIDNGACQPFAAGYINYCNSGDQFCCSSLDTSNDAHHTYQNFYTNSTAQWVIGRYRNATTAA